MTLRVLLTGMSGTGKSSVIAALVARGYRAADADYGLSETAADGEWVWNEALVEAYLAAEDVELLFLAGTARNQGRFYPRFDHVVLLTAPIDLLLSRLATRRTNDFGKDPAERAQVLEDLALVEPLLRRRATMVLDTSAPLAEVVDAVLRHVTGAGTAQVPPS